MNSRRDHYFPNTEPLAADEMRIIALGTGRPFVRRAQANCSWLIELGNGDKFIMDFGSGSHANFTALEIPHQDITAYFVTNPERMEAEFDARRQGERLGSIYRELAARREVGA